MARYGQAFKDRVVAGLHRLKIKLSYLKPRVNDYKAFAKRLFRTAKYQLEFSPTGLKDLEVARA